MPVSKNRRKDAKSPSSKPRKPPLAPVPDRRATERLMAEPGGDDRDDALGRAQEIMYDAWEAADKRTRIAMAKKALKISPHCADAFVILAEDAAKSIVEERDYYAAAVEAGESAVGAKAFKQYAGHF